LLRAHAGYLVGMTLGISFYNIFARRGAGTHAFLARHLGLDMAPLA